MAELVTFDAGRNLLTVGEHRLVFHCHHYNVLLQRTVEDALGLEAARQLQRDAAAEASAKLLGTVVTMTKPLSAQERIAQAVTVFGSLGFGAAEAQALGDEGGEVVLSTSHYALGWRAKFGRARAPVCHFAVGYFRAAVAVATGRPVGAVHGDEVTCAAVSGEACRLRIHLAG